MDIRLEIVDDGREEIVIRCRQRTDKIDRLFADCCALSRDVGELVLYVGNTEYYVPKDTILFFETFDGKLYAHTAERMYHTSLKLFEISHVMPSWFVRVAKSTVVNIKAIVSLSRELTGGGEIAFADCDKTVRFSRGYYKMLKDTIEEVRFSK